MKHILLSVLKWEDRTTYVRLDFRKWSKGRVLIIAVNADLDLAGFVAAVRGSRRFEGWRPLVTEWVLPDCQRPLYSAGLV